jgi:hypothetical protein
VIVVSLHGLPRLPLLVPFAFMTVLALVVGQFGVQPGREWQERAAVLLTLALLIVGLRGAVAAAADVDAPNRAESSLEVRKSETICL